MNRIQLLAAETFYYSYANYKDHLGIGNERFECQHRLRRDPFPSGLMGTTS